MFHSLIKSVVLLYSFDRNCDHLTALQRDAFRKNTIDAPYLNFFE